MRVAYPAWQLLFIPPTQLGKPMNDFRKTWICRGSRGLAFLHHLLKRRVPDPPRFFLPLPAGEGRGEGPPSLVRRERAGASVLPFAI